MYGVAGILNFYCVVIMRGLSLFLMQEEVKQLKSEKLRLQELSHLVPPGDMFLDSETGEIHKTTSSSLLMAGELSLPFIVVETHCRKMLN